MNEFFGISMTYIMIGLLVILAAAFASVGWVLLRNRIMFLVGVRNIPRRRAQTTLIIIGLMLSTVIISAAFSVGDTANYSVEQSALNRLGHVDQIVQVQADGSGDDDDPFSAASLITALPMEQEQAFGFAGAPEGDRSGGGTFRDIENVDGAVSVVRGPVAARNDSKTLAEPLTMLIGVEVTQLAGFEDDFVNTGGEPVEIGALAEGEIYANESAADELDIEVGDRLTLFAGGQPHAFTVRDVVRDRVLTGTIGIDQGFVLPMDRVQAMLGREGKVDLIAVSNTGGVRDSVQYSEEVTAALNRAVAGTRLRASETKADALELAADTASVFVTIFVVLGLFSIAAGMMLIFLIFVMLAAERKMEMGMMRAVGTKRSHLVQSFMSEGMVYNVGAAAVGCALGVAVGAVMIQVMKQLFQDINLDITFHVSARSLIVSYSVGVVLTFLTVTFSSWRTGNLNIVSAIRDVPDPPALRPRPSYRSPLSFVGWFFFKSPSIGQFFLRLLFVGGAALMAVAGYVLMFMVAPGAYDSGAAGGVIAVILAIIGGILIAVGAVLALVLLNSMFQAGPLMLLAGVPLLALGYDSGQAFPAGLGLTLIIVGTALCVQSLGAPARPVFTTMGLTILVFWLLFAGNNVPGLKELEGDIEMFFLSGLTMVLAATFVLIYNADLLLKLLVLGGHFMSTLVPSIKTAVAYPLANKFRTGMTIAMISLVMFALVMMSTMNENFDRVFLSENADGGYDIIATENPGNPIESITAAMEAEGGDASQIEREDFVRQANRSIATACEVETGGPPCRASSFVAGDDAEANTFDTYDIAGVSDGFMAHTTLRFQSRAVGFDSDRAVWEAMRENPDYAVVDAFSVAGGGGFDDGSALIDSIEATDATFEPVRVDVRDSSTGEVRPVQVIGVIATEGSGLYSGLFLTEEAFNEAFASPESTVHLLQVTAGADSKEVAREVESTLLHQGVQADSIQKLIEDFQAQSRGFLYLIQGFMGIGLFVGIAAVGVIAFRTVVERRQQIGMLRAIGYTRRAIALSFLMESSFTALLGIVSGIVLGLLLAYQLTQTDDFIPGGIETFYIPWNQILFIGGLAFVASLVMTIIPSRQASSIPIAEALRYE